MRQKKSILRIGTALFMACLLTFAWSTAAFAAGTNGADVRNSTSYLKIVPSDYSADGETLNVHVAINEAATDGVFTVSYDPEVLSITSDDITVTELPAVHSANVTRPGTLKLAFIAGDTHDTGDIAVLHFTVLKANEDAGLVLSGEVYNEDDNMLGEGNMTLYPDEKPSNPTYPSTSAPADTEPQQTSAPEITGSLNDVDIEPEQTSASDNINDKDQIPDTGNVGPIALGITAIVSLCSAVICTVAYRRSKR